MLHKFCLDPNVLNTPPLNFVQTDRVDDEEVLVQGLGTLRDLLGADVLPPHIERLPLPEQSKRLDLSKQKSNCHCNIIEAQVCH